MKYIVLLGLLLGCSSKPLYNPKDCVRIYTDIGVLDVVVLEVFKDKYVTSPVFLFKGKPNYLPNSKSVFPIDYIDSKSKKIDCSEAE